MILLERCHFIATHRLTVHNNPKKFLFKIEKDSSIADKYEHTSLPTKDCSKTYLFGVFF